MPVAEFAEITRLLFIPMPCMEGHEDIDQAA